MQMLTLCNPHRITKITSSTRVLCMKIRANFETSRRDYLLVVIKVKSLLIVKNTENQTILSKVPQESSGRKCRTANCTIFFSNFNIVQRKPGREKLKEKRNERKPKRTSPQPVIYWKTYRKFCGEHNHL